MLGNSYRLSDRQLSFILILDINSCLFGPGGGRSVAKTGYQAGRLKAPTVRGRRSAVRVKWLKDCSGAAASEFALILPVMLLIFFAIIQFGLTLNNYIELTNAAVSGARQA